MKTDIKNIIDKKINPLLVLGIKGRVIYQNRSVKKNKLLAKKSVIYRKRPTVVMSNSKKFLLSYKKVGKVLAVEFTDVTKKPSTVMEDYRLLAETLSFGLYRINNKGKFLYINGSFARMTGYRKEDIMKWKDWSKLVPKKSMKHASKIFKKLLSGKKVENTLVLKRKNKKEITVFFDSTPLKIHGKVENITGMMIDVTKHMIAENALERKMKSLSTEKASLIQAKKQLDLETRQLSNEVNKIVLGSQEIGKGDTGYRFKISDFKRLISVVSVINATNTKLEEIINVSQHNTQELLRREEISREYTRNLKSSLDDLKRLDQMKTNFLSITSHELKTPLTPITSQLQLLLGRVYGDINEKQEESLNMVLRNIKRLTQLINDIATSSKIVRGKFFLASRLTDIENIVENVTEDFITTAMTKKVDLKIKIEKSIPKMMIDNDRFTQVLTNLISNSMKFNKPNGNIWVDISQVMKDGDNYLKVSVKDTGIGIPKKKQAKLFTPFYQVDASRARKYSGTGLGLSICKSIVEMMGGNIWVDSSSGKGATFSFIIPIRKKEKLKTTSPEKSEPQPEIITTPIVREMTRKGLITKEGKIIEGVMLNNLEGKIKLNYREIIKSIINKARELIKDSAINKANTVSGISVSYADNPSVRIKGSPKEAMENLLAAYRDLLGYLMDTIEEEIAREIIMKKLGVSI